jgi:hypothetical protein
MRATWPTHPILLHLLTAVISSEAYGSWFLPVTPRLCGHHRTAEFIAAFVVKSEKLLVTHLVKFYTSYGATWFVTVFKTARRWSKVDSKNASKFQVLCNISLQAIFFNWGEESLAPAKPQAGGPPLGGCRDYSSLIRGEKSRRLHEKYISILVSRQNRLL